MQPSSVWKAEALNPGIIIRFYLDKSIGFFVSKKRGERPICLRFVSRKAWLMIRLKIIYFTSLFLLQNSSSKKKAYPVSFKILTLTVSSRKFILNSTDSSSSDSVNTVLPAGTKGPIVDSIRRYFMCKIF